MLSPIPRPIYVAISFVTILAGLCLADKTDPFPTPDNLKNNVEFWKKIYTEVGLKQGLLHDREYPMVIYKKLTIGERTGRSRTSYIRAHRKKVQGVLKEITTADKSVWSKEARRIAELFDRYAEKGALSGAHNRVRFQSGQMERFKRGIYRSGAYLDTIRAVLKEYDIPLRLQYLPHVESSFNPFAYSKVGAAGLWQFMRSTGGMFMQIDYDIDERRDPISATVAAAKLLTKNYRETKSWPLAITAYNHGLYGIKRAIANTGSRDIGVIVEKHTSPSFRFASKNFYSCFLAASQIAAEPEKYLKDVTYAPKHQYGQIRLSHYIKPSVIASALGISTSVLQEYNPAIRPVVYQQDKPIRAGFLLKMPIELAPHKALASIGSLPDSLKFDQPPKPKYYKVRRGDNLYAIASRFGVSARELALYNDISRMNRIYTGQIINIPGIVEQSKPKRVAVVEKKAVVKQIEAKKEDKSQGLKESDEKQSARVSTAHKSEEAGKPVMKEVAYESKQTVDKVGMDKSRIEAVSDRPPTKPGGRPAEHDLETAGKRQNQDQLSADGSNPIEEAEQVEEVAALPDSMQDIVLAQARSLPDANEPEVSKRVASSFDADVYQLETQLSADALSARIRVSVNETIGHYADWLGIATWRIRRANNMGRGSWIRIGQRLTIPVDEPSLEQFMQSRLEYHMALEQDFYARFEVTGMKKRSVRRGETPWDICLEEGEIPLWVLSKYNRGLDLGNLMPGQEINIPLIEEKTEEDYAMELESSYQSAPIEAVDMPVIPGSPSRRLQ